LSHTPSPFCFSFSDRVLSFFPASNHNPHSSASCAAGITDMLHHAHPKVLLKHLLCAKHSVH
jgi:hypothetical protein